MHMLIQLNVCLSWFVCVCINLTKLSCLTLHDKQYIYTVSLNIKFICTCTEQVCNYRQALYFYMFQNHKQIAIFFHIQRYCMHIKYFLHISFFQSLYGIHYDRTSKKIVLAGNVTYKGITVRKHILSDYSAVSSTRYIHC